MTPTDFLLDRLATLLATDTSTLAPAANGVKIHLSKSAFTPSPGLTLAGLTEANFDGYAALVAGAGAQQDFRDPVTGFRVVQLLEPVGGWTWETTGTTSLPMTIYGWYVTNNAGTELYGSQLLPAPVTLSASGQGVAIGNIRFTMPPGALV